MRQGEHMFGSWSFLELCRAGFSCLTAITAGTSPSQSQQHACAAGAPHSEGIRPASQNCVISSSSYAFGESLSLGNAIHSTSAPGLCRGCSSMCCSGMLSPIRSQLHPGDDCRLQHTTHVRMLLMPAVWSCCLLLSQAYELLQGNLVRFSPDAPTKDVPTAVLVHGILGSKRNLNSFARMLVEVRFWLCLGCWGVEHMSCGKSCTHTSSLS